MPVPGNRPLRLAPLLAALLSVALVAPLAAQEPSPVTASLEAGEASARPGEVFTLVLGLDMAPGWHVYGPEPVTGLAAGLPTTIVWDLPPGFVALPLEWPQRESFSLSGVESQGYSGSLRLNARFRAPAALPPGKEAAIGARVEWLACRVECMPGGASLKVSLPIVPGPRGVGFALALLLAFAGGLILNLMPCVLPVLSLKALSFARGATGARRPTNSRRRGLAQGLYFTAGVLVSFWIFAGALLVLRAGGLAAGWGFQLQDPSFVSVAAAIFFLLGLNLFGVFELGASLTRLGAGDPRREGRGEAASSFLSGFFATAVATPCTAPFMGVAVGYALSQGAAAALGVFSALGLGMAAPLLAISALPGLARRLPKPGAWLPRFRQILGFPMMAAVIWMAFVLAELRGASALLALLEGLLAAGLGAWVWGNWGGLDRRRRDRAIAAALALLLAAGGIAWSVRGAVAPKGSAAGLAGVEAKADGFWLPWSREALEELRRRGAPVFVDFTAAWCLSCQVNEALALDDGAVRARFAELGVAALKADWTTRDDGVGRALAELERASVPLYALYVPGSEAPVILPELLTPALVLRYLDENLAGSR